MISVIAILILFELCSVIPNVVCSQERDRELYFPSYYFFAGRRLVNHKIKTMHVKHLDDCELLCYQHDDCVSINIKKDSESGTGQQECELNNSTRMEHDGGLTNDNVYLYRGAKNACGKNPLCYNDAICQSGFTDKGYRCSCAPGFKGEHCEKVAASTCKEIHDRNMSNVSQLVTLYFDSKPIPVLCHFGDFGCGDGGWTPVMKIDGNKNTFHYDSGYWNDKSEYNLPGGENGLDTQETKLPSYWNTSFTKICLGMKIGQQINFIVINKQANSLYSLIADGQYRATSLGRNTWETLIGWQASLQPKCNMEGFNAASLNPWYSKARIGILGNNEKGCVSCDSRIGFGTGGGFDDTNTCGNENGWSWGIGNGNKHIKALGYILVQ